MDTPQSELPFEFWYVIVGALLVAMALARSLLSRLPLTTALAYLVVGVAIGPQGANLMRLDPRGEGAGIFLRLTEMAVLVSLFSTGLSLRVPLRDKRWRTPVRLASVAMIVSVGLAALLATWLFGLSWGAAILLAAVLAPTDPVLAGDVKVTHPDDADAVRFGLTGEAGLNDGTAFPFVMLGLALLARESGAGEEMPLLLARWLAVDLVWATAAGLAVGFVLGTCAAKAVHGLMTREEKRLGGDPGDLGVSEFIAFGLIGLSYGVAHLVHGYGFLAVFAAGLAFRGVEERETRNGDVARSGSEERCPVANGKADAHTDARTDETPGSGPNRVRRATDALLETNEQFERLVEVALVLLVGSLLHPGMLQFRYFVFLAVLFLCVRPLAVALSRPAGTHGQRLLMAWFGIRGIGSLYYLAYAFTRSDAEGGPDGPLAPALLDVTLLAVAVSALAHGVSVTPAMNAYGRWKERRRAGRSRGAARR